MKITIHSLLIILSLVLLMASCGKKQSTEQQEELSSLRQQIDSLTRLQDSVSLLTPVLFDSALVIEQLRPDEAMIIYQQIIARGDSSYWAIAAEDRMQRLKLTPTRTALKDLFMMSDTLLLTHVGDDCGEWGGNIETIRIHYVRDNSTGKTEGKIMASYQLQAYDCDSLAKLGYNSKPVVTKSPDIELNAEQCQMVETAITDLLQHKLTNNLPILSGGVTNTVQLKSSTDYSIYLHDYPSFNWTRFQALKTELCSIAE